MSTLCAEHAFIEFILARNVVPQNGSPILSWFDPLDSSKYNGFKVHIGSRDLNSSTASAPRRADQMFPLPSALNELATSASRGAPKGRRQGRQASVQPACWLGRLLEGLRRSIGHYSQVLSRPPIFFPSFVSSISTLTGAF